MDLALLRRVASRGLSLDIVASVENARPVETAIYHVVGLKGWGRPTFILRNELFNYASQMRIEGKHAFITLLAPAPHVEDDFAPWFSLLDAMMRQAGQRGAQFLTAEVPVDAPVFMLFRQAGFTVYSRESLYVLDKSQYPQTQAVTPAATLRLRPIDEDDEFRLRGLYANTVPQLVQQVDSAPETWHGVSILINDRIMGALCIHTGGNTVLIHPYLHPELYDLVPEIFALVLKQLPLKTVYVRLRAYQEWLRNTLHDYGFVEHARYALMARHTVIRQPKTATSPLAALESIIFAHGIEVAMELSPLENKTKTFYGIQDYR